VFQPLPEDVRSDAPVRAHWTHSELAS
jgi:hypothetical protein